MYTKNFIEHDGIEFELPLNPDCGNEPEVVETPTGFRIGYLVHNDGCGDNPLEEWDGNGNIHHHPRDRYGRRDSEYYELMGLDSQGDPIIDYDKVQDKWRQTILAIPPELFTLSEEWEDLGMLKYPSSQSEPRPYWIVLREMLADEEAGDYGFYYQLNCALDDMLCEEARNEIAGRIKDHIHWDWEEVHNECLVGPDPYAVLLDIYEHSGVSYSVSGRGMQCQFDTSRGAAVWAPDQDAKDEIDRRAKVYDYAQIVETHCRGHKYAVQVATGIIIATSNEWHKLFQIAEEIARRKRNAGVAPTFNGHWAACTEIAARSCELYTNWANGWCYGVVIADYDFEGHLINDDSCYGYYGNESAEEELSSQMKVESSDVWEVWENYEKDNPNLVHTTCAYEHASRFVMNTYDNDEVKSLGVYITTNGSTEF